MWLFELASNRSREINRIDSGTDVVIEHLVKIWLFPKYHDVDIWIKHARKALYFTLVLKNGSYLKKDVILKNSFEDHKFQIRFYQEEFIEDHEKYGEYPGYMCSNAYDLDELTKCVKKYFEELAELLSKQGDAHREDIDKIIADSGLLDIPEEDRYDF